MSVVEDMLVWKKIGELLAAAAHYFQRRLGGPGATRRLASVVVAFVMFMVTLVVRQRATSTLSVETVAHSRTLRHLRRPPQGWAAP